MDATGNYMWYYNSEYSRSASWIVVSGLYNYLINNDYIGPQGYWMSNSPEYPATKGDIIQMDTNYDGVYNHSMWIVSHQTGTISLTRIACHSDDRWNEPYTSIVGTSGWIKLSGYGE